MRETAREMFYCRLCSTKFASQPDDSECPECGATGIKVLEDVQPGSANQPQPPPKPSVHPAVWSLVMRDMIERDIIGAAKYGVRLQPRNGRDALVDLYQELLDAAVYARQAIYERDGK